MPKNKDFKRLARTRMRKTGESYTTARARLLDKRRSAAAPPEGEYARLAGMSDAAVKAKTGCDWKRWVKTLDAGDAASMPHREIARHVHGGGRAGPGCRRRRSGSGLADGRASRSPAAGLKDAATWVGGASGRGRR